MSATALPASTSTSPPSEFSIVTGASVAPGRGPLGPEETGRPATENGLS